MNKSLIELYLQKAANGEAEYIEKLCKQLADRLLFVPLATPIGSTLSQAKLSVVTIKEEHRTIVPVFTKQQKLESWCKGKNIPVNFVSLLGADFCLSLLGKSWIRIDEGSGAFVELQPALVDKVASAESMEGMGAESTTSSGSQDSTEEPVVMLEEHQQVKRAQPPSEPTLSDAATNGSEAQKDMLLEYLSSGSNDELRSGKINRSSTNLRVSSTNMPSISSELKKQISAPSSSEKQQNQKKKSFLNFLKTGRA